MKVLIVNTGLIPVHKYGGTERVIWWLGRELVKLGHTVNYLVKQGSQCDFAPVIHIDENKPLIEQIPNGYDIIHFNFQAKDIEKINTPYIITIHGNSNNLNELDRNAVFVSKNHASRYNSVSYVYNGLDWSEYSTPDLENKRKHFHFLGNAAWKVKNVKGAIDVINKTKTERLEVLGGVRFNFKMGIRFTFSSKVSFRGMIGGKEKFKLLNESKGLIFPVRWHEPFGLAIIESLYFGCPVFGTPYGSLPELVNEDVGFLSYQSDELVKAILNHDRYSSKKCREYAVKEFNSKKMTMEYVKKYELVISGNKLSINPPKLLKIQEEKWLDWK